MEIYQPILHLSIYPWQAPQWTLLSQRLFNQSLAHALLLQGYEGLGKLHFAKQFAMRLLCESSHQQTASACGFCRQCRLMMASGHPDCFFIQPEEEQNAIKIDQIRSLIAKLHETPQCGNKQVVIIHPAQKMNTAAQNCLLKILEEPPAHVFLLLISHHPQGLLATIRSRCQFVQFYPNYDDNTLQWLSQHPLLLGLDGSLLLKESQGCPLTVLKKVESKEFEERDAFYADILALFLKKTSPSTLALKWSTKDATQYIDYLLYFVLSILKCLAANNENMILNKDALPILNQMSKNVSQLDVFSYIDKLMLSRRFFIIKANCNLQLLLEDILIDWVKLQQRFV